MAAANAYWINALSFSRIDLIGKAGISGAGEKHLLVKRATDGKPREKAANPASHL